MFVLQEQEWLPFWGKCSFAHRQVDTQPTKWSKSNNDKSAVALLKKGDWHERESVTDRYHDRSGKPDQRSDKKLGRNSSKERVILTFLENQKGLFHHLVTRFRMPLKR